MINTLESSKEARAQAAKSVNSKTKFTIIFINNHKNRVQLIWKTYKGDEKIYASAMKTGASFRQPTFGTHPFIARDVTTKKLLVFTNSIKTDIVCEGGSFGATAGSTIKARVLELQDCFE